MQRAFLNFSIGVFEPPYCTMNMRPARTLTLPSRQHLLRFPKARRTGLALIVGVVVVRSVECIIVSWNYTALH